MLQASVSRNKTYNPDHTTCWSHVTCLAVSFPAKFSQYTHHLPYPSQPGDPIMV